MILHMSRQQSCRDICKIVIIIFLRQNNMHFSGFRLWAHKCFVKWIPGQHDTNRKHLSKCFRLSPCWNAWASIHKADGRLTARSREVSKPRDSGLNFSNRSEIWQTPRQHRYRDACQISERYDHYNIQSRGFETSRDLGFKTSYRIVNRGPVQYFTNKHGYEW